MEFLGWPYNDGVQSNVGYIGLVVHETGETNITKHKGDNMKITKSLTERLFVMFLQREFDLARRVGEIPSMKQSVTSANYDMIHAIETIKEGGI